MRLRDETDGGKQAAANAKQGGGGRPQRSANALGQGPSACGRENQQRGTDVVQVAGLVAFRDEHENDQASRQQARVSGPEGRQFTLFPESAQSRGQAAGGKQQQGPA